jgi:hypothetical protein
MSVVYGLVVMEKNYQSCRVVLGDMEFMLIGKVHKPTHHKRCRLGMECVGGWALWCALLSSTL